MDKTDLGEEILHSQFVEKGIEMAVENLLDLETESVNILAFSISGTISWKAYSMNVYRFDKVNLNAEVIENEAYGLDRNSAQIWRICKNKIDTSITTHLIFGFRPIQLMCFLKFIKILYLQLAGNGD